MGSAWRSVCACRPGLPAVGSAVSARGAFACCASVLSVVVKNFAGKLEAFRYYGETRSGAYSYAFSVFRLEFIINSMAFRSLAAAGAVVSAAAYVLWHQRKRWVRIPGQGLLIGAAEDGVIRFLGVPFASIVDKRWQPPGRPESWVFPRRNPTKLWRCPQPCIGWNGQVARSS